MLSERKVEKPYQKLYYFDHDTKGTCTPTQCNIPNSFTAYTGTLPIQECDSSKRETKLIKINAVCNCM